MKLNEYVKKQTVDRNKEENQSDDVREKAEKIKSRMKTL